MVFDHDHEIPCGAYEFVSLPSPWPSPMAARRLLLDIRDGKYGAQSHELRQVITEVLGEERLACGCRDHCGDLPESEDRRDAVCVGLPRRPPRRGGDAS